MYSLEEGASRESLLCAPCWPEAQETENPAVLALGGLQLRKGGKGMILLLCNKSWPCLCCCLKKTDPSRKVSKVLEDACSVSKPCTPCFSALPSLLYAPFTCPNQPSDLRGTPRPTNSIWSSKELAMHLQQGLNISKWTDLLRTPMFLTLSFPLLFMSRFLSSVRFSFSVPFFVSTSDKVNSVLRLCNAALFPGSST